MLADVPPGIRSAESPQLMTLISRKGCSSSAVGCLLFLGWGERRAGMEREGRGETAVRM